MQTSLEQRVIHHLQTIYADIALDESYEAIADKLIAAMRLQADTASPPTLFTTSTRADRVHPGHARKMAARMIELGKEVLFYENVEGGHSGAADHRQGAFMEAMAYTFLARQLGTAHWFDIGAARSDLGYEPRISLDEGFEFIRRWFEAEASEG